MVYLLYYCMTHAVKMLSGNHSWICTYSTFISVQDASRQQHTMKREMFLKNIVAHRRHVTRDVTDRVHGQSVTSNFTY
jgi:hypothetical protein